MKKAFGIVALAGVLIAPLTGCQNFIENEPVTCTVTGKDRSTEVVDGSSKSVFRVYTDCDGDNSTLGIGDNLLKGQFNSSDIYGKLKEGERYTFHTTGYRNGFFSSFREIYKADPA